MKRRNGSMSSHGKARMRCTARCAFGLAALWLFSGGAAADAQNDGVEAPITDAVAEQKTEVRADQVDMDLKAGTAVFEGNVLVSDGRMILEAARMTVHFTESNRLTRIEATGNVVITQPDGDRRATAGRAFYDMESGEVVLTENPTLRMGEHSLQNAEQIIYHRDNQRFSTKAKPGQRVKVQFMPDEEGGNIELFDRQRLDTPE